RYRRLGDVRERQSDVRLISASHQDLKNLVRDSKFRSDLYFRISTVVIRVAPLRERRNDIPILATEFLQRAATDLGRPTTLTLSEDASAALCSYSWPGNVRELKNVIERAALLSKGEIIQLSQLHLDGDWDSECYLTNMTL